MLTFCNILHNTKKLPKNKISNTQYDVELLDSESCFCDYQTTKYFKPVT